MLKRKLLRFQEGFTLVEVLASILITTLFVTITMQGMLMAAVLRVRAREYTQSIAWIQQDLETVRSIAATASQPTATQCSPQDANSGLAYQLMRSIPGISVNTGTKTTVQTSSNGQQYNVNLTATIANTYPYESLRLNYTVTPNSGSTTLARAYTEIIPRAYFLCPQRL